ncbi:MAG: bifunctional diaminohydroxyphosphoribosylaminopyrimidine deaminase/5-amino-6-(5-phosphoribosylamino)uracil reductase RibD [Synechococcales cyanobacterium CRU_2_2]|nr:bifunctional diaminohydroxyphosphoribosylaminopyrimidine deaminase/5-amino-6-(5-phosphoribosylamino)uracil reductase RibD [Synechococcales cyanobacterium CRU_2_2]
MTTVSLDAQMMQRCLTLARRALGQTAPNPMVGAVLVKDGQIIGEGFHPGAGQPHAEVFALREAGAAARGATAYVSLEPCNHYGRTPPCAKALVEAGVAKVVVGMVDPNPLVAGGGLQTLRDAGIEVVVGVEEAACQRLNEAFVHRIVHQQLFGILKYAMTLDGKTAAVSGHSNWITQPESRARVHQMRLECDAVIVGGNTVRSDDPLLTTHGLAARNPLRVVMSRTLELPETARLWDVGKAATVVFTEAGDGVVGVGVIGDGRQSHQTQMIQLLRSRGVEVVALADLTPAAVMKNLYDRGLLSVLWECGGTLAAAAIADGSIHKVQAFIAPKIIGGSSFSPVGNLGLTRMDQALQLQQVSWQALGTDLLLEGYLRLGQEA